ncbi:AAA family ATPase [Rheinheimera sp. EpRS3]|uniref:AAA family ATPase n=1 Tax=Rheinheimera sp. EpRS3 TaxID=1712383 RepID=UPI0007485C7B|nr:AAA family ATPase [Rheinheimera sp. EpRS3]KUM53298.1 hypothetical protein AR688_05095 [Rheinheimera sp. EpRS3]
MTKLAIRNVGPIKNGLSKNKFIDFGGLTILIGTQGSGKSTIAKVYSSLCWLEKSLVRGDVTKDVAESKDYFLNEVMSFQGISDYFSEKSHIEFIGEKYNFILNNLNFNITEKENRQYASPKIMYVPAERNFLTSIVRPDLISKLPKALHAFLAEYEEAKDYSRSKLIDLPIGNLKYQYDPDDGSSYLVGESFRTNLLNGSSGYQSLIPLFLVTEYLCDLISQQDQDSSEVPLSVALQRRMMKEVKVVMERQIKLKKIKSLMDEIKRVQNRFIYSSFINIVEEPEQNLYPDSQKKILFELLKTLNSTPENRLVVTTHSPYILNFMMLNFQAGKLYKKNLSETSASEVEKIVPRNSVVESDKVRVYQLSSDGTIENLEFEDGYIPDTNKLNHKLDEINDQFSQLLYMDV